MVRRILFFGPTGGGRSTLANKAILSAALLDTGFGHTTKRSYLFRYAPLDEARVYLMKIGENSDAISQVVSFSTTQKPNDVGEHKKWQRNMNTKLKNAIKEKSAEPDTLEKFNEWNNYVVVVEFPFQFLKENNVEIMDISGSTSSSDHSEILKDSRKKIISEFSPDGIIFVSDEYDGIDSEESFKELQNIVNVPLFFIKTKCDHVAHTNLSEKEFEEYNQKCIPFDWSSITPDNFSCSTINGKDILNYLMKKLSNWISALE